MLTNSHNYKSPNQYNQNPKRDNSDHLPYSLINSLLWPLEGILSSYNKKPCNMQDLHYHYGGESGIRTHGTAHHRTLDFVSSAFDQLGHLSVVYSFSSQPAEELFHQLTAFLFQYTCSHINPVIQPRVLNNIHQGMDSTRFGVSSPIN